MDDTMLCVNNNKVKKLPATVSILRQSDQHLCYATKYRVGDSIGGGSFGDVFKCASSKNNNDLLAIKFEKKANAYPQLYHEYNVNTDRQQLLRFSPN